MLSERPYVASIAGFDPSAGAGILADIKTFEMHHVYGFGINTAMTWQNDVRIAKIEWLSLDNILAQLKLLFQRFDIHFFKIGIVENAQTLRGLVDYINNKSEQATIVWDPVIKASSGFAFSDFGSQSNLFEGISIVTPNQNEFEQLFESKEQALALSHSTLIYLKGGHNLSNPGLDVLYNQGAKTHFEPQTKEVFPKHGSGCVFSSSLCANLANGLAINEACQSSKNYIESLLASNQNLLGYHKQNKFKQE